MANLTLPPIQITISRTADGSADYMQIISADQFSLNIVLISSRISIRDARPDLDKGKDATVRPTCCRKHQDLGVDDGGFCAGKPHAT